MNDIDKSIVLISKLLKIIEERKELLKENNCLTVDEYNKYVSDKLPLIVFAIDDDNSLLKNPDIEKMLTGIITNLTGLRILFILVTSLSILCSAEVVLSRTLAVSCLLGNYFTYLYLFRGRLAFNFLSCSFSASDLTCIAAVIKAFSSLDMVNNMVGFQWNL